MNQKSPPAHSQSKESEDTTIDQNLTKLTPTELDADSHSPKFDIATIWAIAALKHGDAITAAASEEEILWLCTHTLGSNSTTPKEQALGGFT